MKKRLILIILLMLTLALTACSGGGEKQDDALPPALSYLQGQTTLYKHEESGKTASFSKEELLDTLGEEFDSVTVTSLPESGIGTLIFNGYAVTKGQTLPADSLEFLKFVPTAECKTASFCMSCDSDFFDDAELTCEIVYGDSVNSPPVALSSSADTVEGIACVSSLEINEPDGDGFTINVITYPSDGYVTVDSDGVVVYTPEEGFIGSDKLVYSVTDRFGKTSEVATLSITVAENEGGITFADMSEDARHLYAYKLCSKNIMVYRYENGEYLFDPAQPVSKLDFLVMLMSASGQDNDVLAVADSSVTDDGGLSSGLKGYLSAAAEKDIIKLDNGAFSPKSDVTVSDAAYMIASVLDLPGLDSESILSGESDRSFASLIAVTDAGIFDVAEPAQTLTKGDTAEILCRVLDYMRENNMSGAIDKSVNK
ncbi:MAG: cadherin-like domain-containing protein [Clostridia bacterium]|nr:cadherin-like domain-containing protein [Clostridia bacterium]